MRILWSTGWNSGLGQRMVTLHSCVSGNERQGADDKRNRKNVSRFVLSNNSSAKGLSGKWE